jgi:mannose-6-phosphate isomerase-like protein (cupin superfamily)
LCDLIDAPPFASLDAIQIANLQVDKEISTPPVIPHTIPQLNNTTGILMNKFDIDPQRTGFKVLSQTKRSEAATMVIKPGDKEGGPENKHAGDQWLYVLSGKGTAIIEGKLVHIKRGTLLEIAEGETHEIKNTGRTNLRTLNFYSPVIY